MIIEFLGGPNDGERKALRDGEKEYAVPLPQAFVSMADAAGLTPASVTKARIGYYVAEPYKWTLDKKAGLVKIDRLRGTTIMHVHLYVLGGGSEHYWNNNPMIFTWEGER